MTQTEETAGLPAADTQEPQIPTVTYYQQLAMDLLTETQATATKIPGFSDPVPTVPLRRVATPRFVTTTLNAIGASEHLEGTGGTYADEARNAVQFAEAFVPLRDYYRYAFRRLDLLLRHYDSKSGRGAVRAFKFAESVLLENPDDAKLASLVQAMRAERPRRKPRKRQRPVTPPPADPEKGGAPTS